MELSRPIMAMTAVSLALLHPLPPAALAESYPRPLEDIEDEEGNEAALLAEWVRATDGKPSPTTVFRVVETVKEVPWSPAPGDEVTLTRKMDGEPGRTFLLRGRQHERKTYWDPPLPAGRAVLDYIRDMPSSTAPERERLLYAIQHLESPEALVAEDAFARLGEAYPSALVTLAPEFPAERLRRWVADRQVPPYRAGQYALMLGLFGMPEDARLLGERAFERIDEPVRPGLDGFMTGYLLLAGEEGLDRLDREKLRDPEAPISELLAAEEAIAWQWTFGGGRIGPARLKASMRLLLDQDEFADLAVSRLARWKDWESRERIVALYDRPEPAPLRRAVVHYLLMALRDVPDGAGEALPPHAAAAREDLERLRARDPETVARVEKWRRRLDGCDDAGQ